MGASLVVFQRVSQGAQFFEFYTCYGVFGFAQIRLFLIVIQNGFINRHLVIMIEIKWHQGFEPLKYIRSIVGIQLFILQSETFNEQFLSHVNYKNTSIRRYLYQLNFSVPLRNKILCIHEPKVTRRHLFQLDRQLFAQTIVFCSLVVHIVTVAGTLVIGFGESR